MKLRGWFLSVVAISFLGMTAWAGSATAAQNSNSGDMNMGITTTRDVNQQNANNQSANQNQNQNEQPAPQKPTYLTFTEEANPGLAAGKTGQAYTVDLKSLPAGADITVDGYYVGRSPATVQLPAGKYLVRIQKWGYQDWVHEYVVSSGSNLNLSPNLKPDW